MALPLSPRDGFARESGIAHDFGVVGTHDEADTGAGGVALRARRRAEELPEARLRGFGDGRSNRRLRRGGACTCTSAEVRKRVEAAVNLGGRHLDYFGRGGGA